MTTTARTMNEQVADAAAEAYAIIDRDLITDFDETIEVLTTALDVFSLDTLKAFTASHDVSFARPHRFSVIVAISVIVEAERSAIRFALDAALRSIEAAKRNLSTAAESLVAAGSDPSGVTAAIERLDREISDLRGAGAQA